MWIPVTERMPEMGRTFPVFGEYTPEGYGFPKAYRRDVFGDGNIIWCSTQWRGTVGITYWWDESEKAS